MQRRQFLLLLGAAGLLPGVQFANGLFGEPAKIAEAVSHSKNVLNTLINADSALLIRAILREQIELVESLIQNGSDVNAKGNYDNTPLHWWAVGSKNIEIANTLISYGANVNAQNKDGNSPLHWAAHYCKNVEVTQFLVSQGADVNAKGKCDKTPLDLAQECGNATVVEYLINIGAR